MKTAILTVGLPRAGKSTWAKKYAKECGAAIINPDSFRLALHGQTFVPEAEEIVWAMCAIAFKAVLIAGHDTVILDATNLTNRRREKWESLIVELGIRMNETIQIQYKVFDTPMETCIERAMQDGRQDLLRVIRTMNYQTERLIGKNTL